MTAMKTNKNQRKMIQFAAAYLLALLGIALMAGGMLLPPLGRIDPTVLTAFGEIATFAGAMMGMDYHYSNKSPHGQKGEEEEA